MVKNPEKFGPAATCYPHKNMLAACSFFGYVLRT